MKKWFKRLGKQTGDSYRPEYRRWYAMLSRCYNPKDKKFKNYGGRGITVCQRWIDRFSNFFDDMGEAPKGTMLDRINTDGNYEPGNCRWATPAESNRNYSTRNKMFTYNGETKCMKDWAKEFGIPYPTFWRRIAIAGYDFEKAVSTPIRRKFLGA